MQRNPLTGFDFLRAIFSVVVVAVHVNLFVVLSGKLRLAFVADIFNQNIGYLAVPVFYQLSLFLFFQKASKEPDYFLKKRFPRLVFLYLFWVIAKLLFDAIATQDSSKIRNGFSSVQALCGFVISGGYSAFYFFFSLLFLTAIAAGLVRILQGLDSERLKAQIQSGCLLASCILIASFPIIHAVTGRDRWFFNTENPLNFLPYIFTAAIASTEYSHEILQHSTRLFKLKLWTLFSLFLLFTVLEWLCFKTFLGYARLSLVFGSWLLL